MKQLNNSDQLNEGWTVGQVKDWVDELYRNNHQVTITLSPSLLEALARLIDEI